MRILALVGAVAVFGAMLLFDVSALARVAILCVTGGCGVRPTWIAFAAGGVALAVLLSFRRSRPHAMVRGKRTPRKRAGARRKVKRANSRPTAASSGKRLAD
jgi:hypothetical protein